MVAHRLLPVMVHLRDGERSMFVNTFSDTGDGCRRAGQVASQRVFIGHVGRMDNMLFQHDDTRAASRARCIVASVLLAQEIMAREIGAMTAENNTVSGFARPDCQRLEEFIRHENLTWATARVVPTALPSFR